MDTASESYCFREKNTLESKLSNGEVSLEKDFEQSKSRSNLKIARSRTISPPPLPQWTSSLTGHSWEYFINTRPVSRKIQLVCSSVRLLLPINAQHRQSVGSQAKTFGNAGWFVGKFAVPLEGGGEKKGRKKLQQRAWKSGDACWFFCWKKYLPKRNERPEPYKIIRRFLYQPVGMIPLNRNYWQVINLSSALRILFYLNIFETEKILQFFEVNHLALATDCGP